MTALHSLLLQGRDPRPPIRQRGFQDVGQMQGLPRQHACDDALCSLPGGERSTGSKGGAGGDPWVSRVRFETLRLEDFIHGGG